MNDEDISQCHRCGLEWLGDEECPRCRDAPEISVYEAKTIDGSCSGCPETKDVLVLKIAAAHSNGAQTLRFCPRCLEMVFNAFGNSFEGAIRLVK